MSMYMYILPSNEEWIRLCWLKCVFLYLFYSKDDLFAVNVDNALHFLALPLHSDSAIPAAVQDDNIFASHLCITHSNLDQATNTTYYLSDAGNVKFMRPQRTKEIISCTKTLRARMLNKKLNKLEKKASFDMFAPAYTAGRVFSLKMLDRLSPLMYYNPYLIVILILLSANMNSGASNNNSIGDQSLVKEEVPSQYYGCSFAYLFGQFIMKEKVVIALYRAPSVERGNSIPYVYTCPERDTVICPGDTMFVIA